MTTAITLVNRVRRRFREEDVTALGDDMSNFVLDLLNEAKRDILESWTWEFDKRSDGELLTRASLEGLACSVSQGDSEIYFTYAGTATQKANYFIGIEFPVAKVIVTSDPDFGDTAFQVESFNPANTSYFWSAQNGLPEFKGTTDASATATIVFDEYVLPSTVRAVTSVRHQEQDLQIAEVDRDIGMDSYAPRPHGSMSNAPERVFIGKFGISTYRNDFAITSSSARYRAGITMKFDPTPNARLAISYSYIYRHPDISSTQDLQYVDPAVEDMIVRLAEARGTMSGLGADVQTGAAMETEVLNRCAAIHGNIRRDPLRRVVIGPTYGGVSSTGFGRIPRNVGSL